MKIDIDMFSSSTGMTSVFYRPQQDIKTHAYAPLARGGHYDTCGGGFSVFPLSPSWKNVGKASCRSEASGPQMVSLDSKDGR